MARHIVYPNPEYPELDPFGSPCEDGGPREFEDHPAPKSIYSLPIFEWAWKADAREIGR